MKTASSIKATNILPSGIGALFQLGERVVEGLAAHGPWLLNNFMTAAAMRGWLETAQRTEKEFARVRAEKAAAARSFKQIETRLTDWLAAARLVVMLALGRRWSQSWVAAGFTHRGTNVPKRLAGRIELNRRLAEFFAARPEFEVAFAKVTAAEAEALREAMTRAQKELRTATIDAATRKRARDKAEKLLRWKMSGLRGVLSVALKRHDPRWRAFGFKVPRPGEQADGRYGLPVAAREGAVAVEFAPAAPAAPATAVAVVAA